MLSRKATKTRPSSVVASRGCPGQRQKVHVEKRLGRGQEAGWHHLRIPRAFSFGFRCYHGRQLARVAWEAGGRRNAQSWEAALGVQRRAPVAPLLPTCILFGGQIGGPGDSKGGRAMPEAL